MTAPASQRTTGSLLHAGLAYAELGWPVLPGPICDGMASWHPASVEPLRCDQPSVNVELATTDSEVISRWWTRFPAVILTVLGTRFDVLRVPTPTALQATVAMSRGSQLGPVALAADGTRFFVKPGSTLKPEMACIRGVELVRRGSLIPLPPSRIKPGVVSWWISPTTVKVRLGNACDIQDAILGTLPNNSATHLPLVGHRNEQYLRT